MLKLKLLLASMLLAFAFGAIAAASASAETAVFELEGEGVKEGTVAKFGEEEETDSKTFELKAKEAPTIKCTKTEVVGGEFTVDHPEIAMKSIHFSNCTTPEEGCKVPTIATKEMKDTVETVGSEDTDEKFAPKSGTVIAEFKLEGALCKPVIEKKTLRIEGDFISKEEDHEKDAEHQPIVVEVPESANEIKYGDQVNVGSINVGWNSGTINIINNNNVVPRPWGLCRHSCPF